MTHRLVSYLFVFVLAGCVDTPDRASALGGATEVRLVNQHTAPLRDVTVYVTGRTYFIGEIAPGDSASLHASPTSESTVMITHLHRSDLLVINSYFEPGYGGLIRAELLPDSVLSVHQDFFSYSR